jgi:hypothetical protein
LQLAFEVAFAVE